MQTIPATVLNLLAAVGDPDVAIGRLELLPSRLSGGGCWRRRLNATGIFAVLPATLPQLFAAQAADAAGSADAFVFAYERLSCRALGAVNRLAHRLPRAEVGAETIGWACVERSLELLVGLLGILEAGAPIARLPTRATQPTSGIHHREDAGAALITTTALGDRRCAGHGARIIDLDAAADAIAAGNARTGDRAEPHNLAYVIYTSGSTGTPKASPIKHGGISSLAAARIERFDHVASAFFSLPRWLDAGDLAYDCSFDIRCDAG